ncbi:histidine kinase [Oscillatoria amoena NRMC-F 0135]|nr:histidine kinase [Oscillatoria amoena NRMC-F 0135]
MINNKRRLYWILQLSTWTVYAMLQIIFFNIQSQQTIGVQRVVFFIVEAAICFSATHFFRYFLNRLRWLSLPVPAMIPRVVGSIVLLGIIIYFLRIPVSYWLNIAVVRTSAFQADQIFGYSAFYIFLLFLWSVFYFTYHYVERYNKSLKYEASLIESELNNLKAQLNPHFIFNALNSIRALVDENPEKSKLAINQLSNILRNSLTFDKRGLTKFGDELKIVRDYLSLESIRFEERLKTEFDIHPDSYNYFVPPFMVQTLVENGVKHGVSKLKAGGLIQVLTRVENEKLKIQIRNSGHLLNGVRRSTSGVGLQNTVHRLRLLYGDSASFRIVNEMNNFVLTEIIIPQTTRNESTDHR